MKLLPDGWYNATVTQSYIQERKQTEWLHVCFTVNTGEHAYKHIIKKYPVNSDGLELLESNFLEMGFLVYKDSSSDLFINQFKGLKSNIHVTRFVDGDVIKNTIIEMKKMIGEPEFDVARPKTEDHFHKRNQGRKLPCNSQDTKMKRFNN